MYMVKDHQTCGLLIFDKLLEKCYIILLPHVFKSSSDFTLFSPSSVA